MFSGEFFLVLFMAQGANRHINIYDVCSGQEEEQCRGKARMTRVYGKFDSKFLIRMTLWVLFEQFSKLARKQWGIECSFHFQLNFNNCKLKCRLCFLFVHENSSLVSFDSWQFAIWFFLTVLWLWLFLLFYRSQLSLILSFSVPFSHTHTHNHCFI